MISQSTIQEVLDLAQVQDIIEDYISLKRRGANLLGLCPFHDEKTPSFTVSPTKNIYKCFGCGKGGGPVQFLMEHDSLSFPEAIRTLAKRYNVAIEESSPDDQKEYEAQKKVEDSYFIINEFAKSYFTDNLFNREEGKKIGLSYFKERGFLGATIEKFDLGFAIDSSKELTEKAHKKQYNEQYLKDLGLTSQRGFDFFRNRVMFPIHNLSGKVIAFAGRTLSNDKKQPKYINSPETPIYTKRKILYGMHLAKNPIRKADVCYIVEGYTDVISLHQNGIENVVASSGTSLTKEQVQLIKRYTNNVTFLFDGDPAGIKASLRGLNIVLESDMNVRLVLLPEGEDPDSFVNKNGHEGFTAYIQNKSKDFLFFKLELSIDEAKNDPVKKAALIKDILESTAKIRDPIKRATYIAQTSQLLEIDEKILVKETNKIIRNEIRSKRLKKEREERRQLRQEYPINEDDYIQEKTTAVQETLVIQNKHEYQEKDLARIMVVAGHLIIKDADQNDVQIADLIYSNIYDVLQYLNSDLYKQIIEEGFRYVETHGENKTVTEYFLNHQEEHIRNFAVNANSSKYEFANWDKYEVGLQTQKPPERNFYKDSLQSIYRFKLKKITTVIKMLGEKITEMQNSQNFEQMNKALEGYKQLSETKKELAAKLGTVVLSG